MLPNKDSFIHCGCAEVLTVNIHCDHSLEKTCKYVFSHQTDRLWLRCLSQDEPGSCISLLASGMWQLPRETMASRHFCTMLVRTLLLCSLGVLGKPQFPGKSCHSQRMEFNITSPLWGPHREIIVLMILIAVLHEHYPSLVL